MRNQFWNGSRLMAMRDCQGVKRSVTNLPCEDESGYHHYGVYYTGPTFLTLTSILETICTLLFSLFFFYPT